MTRAERSRSTRRRYTAVVLVAAVLAALAAVLVVPALAFAHASYMSSVPAANATLKAAPSVVTVHFAEEVNPTGSDIVVFDAKHQQVSTAPAQVERSDLTTMTVSMKGDGSDTYLVEWHTVSATDGDPDIGAFNFFVTASGSQPTGASGSGSSASTGTPAWVVVLVGIVGLVIGGAGGMALARRR